MAKDDRFELSWSRTGVKWVAITDRWTGKRVIGRDNRSWTAAMDKAVAQMQGLINDRDPTPSP
jgi:hypothetical protein